MLDMSKYRKSAIALVWGLSCQVWRVMPCLLVAISSPERLEPSCNGPRGARHQARTSRHELVSGGSGRTPTTMQSSASAAKLRGGGPILNRGAKAMRNTGPPPPRPSTAARHPHADDEPQDLELFAGM